MENQLWDLIPDERLPPKWATQLRRGDPAARARDIKYSQRHLTLGERVGAPPGTYRKMLYNTGTAERARPRRSTSGKKKFAAEARKVREAGEQVEKRVSWGEGGM